jgi:lysophospholipase L1-like esterase
LLLLYSHAKSPALKQVGFEANLAVEAVFAQRLVGTMQPMKHIVLLGDSVFDNGAYVTPDPDVRGQLQDLVAHGWRATLNAVDGAMLTDIASQLHRLPPDATHLVISAGGNDALFESGVLDENATSVAVALEKLAAIRDGFRQRYTTMLQAALGRDLPTAVCTIYEPRFPEANRRRLAATALTLLNDCITREAFSLGVTLIDLRLICNRDEDFANPIEPSVRGGAKIARAIAAFASGAKPSAAVVANDKITWNQR